MKRALLIVALASCHLSLIAQVRLGYLDSDAVMKQMPQYAAAQAELTTLREAQEAEATRGEEEFQRKFTEFLQGQKQFPQNIMLKRQAELQNLMESALAFRSEAQKLLTQKEEELLAAVQQKLNEAIALVGEEGGYAVIINTASGAAPFVSPALGEDITELVVSKLGE